MYESPIQLITTEMEVMYENECIKAVQRAGFDIDKEELIKALQYDRNQYYKGYNHGYEEALRAFIAAAWDLLGAEDDDYYAREVILDIANKLGKKGECIV